MPSFDPNTCPSMDEVDKINSSLKIFDHINSWYGAVVSLSLIHIFMRITGGKNPLDATSVHPESYEIAGELLRRAGVAPVSYTHLPPR